MSTVNLPVLFFLVGMFSSYSPAKSIHLRRENNVNIKSLGKKKIVEEDVNWIALCSKTISNTNVFSQDQLDQCHQDVCWIHQGNSLLKN